MLLIAIVSLVRCIVHGIFGIGYVIFPLCLFSLVLCLLGLVTIFCVYRVRLSFLDIFLCL